MSYKLADIETEFGKNPQLKKEHFLALREWIEKQRHLPMINDLMLISMLQSCYFNNEAAKKAIDSYYTIRTHAPEIFANRDPSILKLHMETALYTILPNATVEGHKIFYAKIMDSRMDRFTFNEQLKIFEMVATMELAGNGTNDGIIALVDMKGSTIGHVARMNVLTVKKFLLYVQEGLPVRLKGIHIMNAMSFVDKFLSLIKPFVKSELKNTFHVHTGMDSLLKTVPLECLPADYGGSAGTLQDMHRRSIDKLIGYREYFLEEEKLVVNESARPGKPKDSNSLFGIEGTFKRLSID